MQLFNIESGVVGQQKWVVGVGVCFGGGVVVVVFRAFRAWWSQLGYVVFRIQYSQGWGQCWRLMFSDSGRGRLFREIVIKGLGIVRSYFYLQVVSFEGVVFGDREFMVIRILRWKLGVMCFDCFSFVFRFFAGFFYWLN